MRAGEVPFRTEQGLDVLPIEARVFFKRADCRASAPRFDEYYRQLYASFRGQPPSADLRLYETAAVSRRQATTPCPAPLEAVDGSIWIALLLRSERSRTTRTTQAMRSANRSVARR